MGANYLFSFTKLHILAENNDHQIDLRQFTTFGWPKKDFIAQDYPKSFDAKERKTQNRVVVGETIKGSIGSLAVWPDLTKFRHFGKKCHAFCKFLTFYFLFGKMLSLLLQIWYIIVLIFILADGQILKNNLTIWSH